MGMTPYWILIGLNEFGLGRRGLPWGSVVKNPLASAGDLGSFPGLGRSPGEGNGNPLQYSCLGKPMDRGAWRATVNGVGHNLEAKQQQQMLGKTLRVKYSAVYTRQEKAEAQRSYITIPKMHSY